MAPPTVANCQTPQDILRRQAERLGDKPFLFCENQEMSFADVDRISDQTAAALQQRGIEKHDVVAVMMGNSADFVTTWLAICKCGAVFVPINTAQRGMVLRHILEYSRCRAIIAEASLLEPVEAELPFLSRPVDVVVRFPNGEVQGRPSLISLQQCSAKLRAVSVSRLGPGVIMFTSGTTGPSKGSLKPHHEAMYIADFVARTVGYTPEDRLYLTLPLFHGNAHGMGLVPAMMAGASVVLEEKFSASKFWPQVRRYGCTVANYVGSIISILAKAAPLPDDGDNPLRVMWGSGTPASLFAEFEQRFKVSLIEGYGLTEIGILLLNLPGNHYSGTCGVVRDDYEVKLINDAGERCAAGETGELLARPKVPNVMMLEYVGMPEKTVEAWRDLWFHTGDYLAQEPDGSFRFVDRKKDAIRRRGENVSSYEVEAAVSLYAPVLECAAVGVPSDLGEEEILVCLVLRPGASFIEQDFLNHCRSHMASFMVPRYVRLMERLPKTATQRVEKYRLRSDGKAAGAHDLFPSIIRKN